MLTSLQWLPHRETPRGIKQILAHKPHKRDPLSSLKPRGERRFVALTQERRRGCCLFSKLVDHSSPCCCDGDAAAASHLVRELQERDK